MGTTSTSTHEMKLWYVLKIQYVQCTVFYIRFPRCQKSTRFLQKILSNLLSNIRILDLKEPSSYAPELLQRVKIGL